VKPAATELPAPGEISPPLASAGLGVATTNDTTRAKSARRRERWAARDIESPEL
jgi:hypothetical protein